MDQAIKIEGNVSTADIKFCRMVAAHSVQLSGAEIEEIKKAVLLAAVGGHQVGGLSALLMRELRELKSALPAKEQ